MQLLETSLYAHLYARALTASLLETSVSKHGAGGYSRQLSLLIHRLLAQVGVQSPVPDTPP
jgi:hypothetical protein